MPAKKMTLKSSGAEVTGDAGKAAALLLWARRERFAVSRVRVGTVEVDVVADLSLATATPPKTTSSQATDLMQQYGGEALKKLEERHAAEDGEASRTTEEDDD